MWRPSVLCYWLSRMFVGDLECIACLVWSATYGVPLVVCSTCAKAQNKGCLDATALTWQHIIASVICWQSPSRFGMYCNNSVFVGWISNLSAGYTTYAHPCTDNMQSQDSWLRVRGCRSQSIRAISHMCMHLPETLVQSCVPSHGWFPGGSYT